MIIEKLVWATLLISLAFAGEITEAASPSCLDDDGNPVDWFVGYKFPQLSGEGHPFNTGYGYMYFTSEDAAKAGHPQPDPKRTVMSRFKDLLIDYLGLSSCLTKSPPAKKKNIRTSSPSSDLRWRFSADKILSDPNSLLMRTLAVAYGNSKKSINTLLYNDDPPMTEEEQEKRKAAHRRAYLKAKIAAAGESPRRRVKRASKNSDSDSDSESDSGSSRGGKSQKAHAKGAIIIDDSNNAGLWVSHSLPQFPVESHEELSMPGNVAKNGQTFICVTFNAKVSGAKIVRHLVNMNPKWYETEISEKLEALIPDLKFVNSRSRKGFTKQGQLAQTFTSAAGQTFELFSKSSLFNHDIYASWLDKELNSPLFVETWRQGKGDPLDSYCPRNDFQVNNIDEMKFINGKNKVTWTYTQDHSKWAITQEQDKGVLCIGDMNRMESQFKRGGGLLCIKCPSCWSVFSNTISEIEPCKIGSKPAIVSEMPAPGQIDWQWADHLRSFF